MHKNMTSSPALVSGNFLDVSKLARLFVHSELYGHGCMRLKLFGESADPPPPAPTASPIHKKIISFFIALM